jgi:hypothetical protein
VASAPPETRATRQIAITIVADVRPAQLDRLKTRLGRMGTDPAGNADLPLAALPRAHFARLLVLDPDRDLEGRPIQPHLLYMADVDAPDEGPALERCLEELVDVAGTGLDRIFGACVGYPSRGQATRERRLQFLSERAVQPAARYVNTVGRSRRQILQEDQLRRAIAGFIDARHTRLSRLPARDVRQAILTFVAAKAELEWALTPAPKAARGDRLRDAVDLISVPLGLLALAPVLAPAFPPFVLALRLQEARDPDPHIVPTRKQVIELADLEDHGTQNQFSALGFIKRGPVRWVTARVVTRGIEYAARHVFNRANLGGVKSIHSARWVWLDDNRRLIFASNYDGSLESYNDDFIDKVWWGLNAVFSNGVGYPRTRWLFFGGARQEQPFKDYLRRHQVPTQVWHSAYPDLTALNVDNNARIRAGLYGAMSEEEAQAWLRLI